MHRRILITATLAALGATSVTTVQAQDAYCQDCQKPNAIERAWKSFCRDFKRNNCWPDPFVTQDRASVRAPLAIMVANGWQVQNTLTDDHFVDNSAVLAESGKLKIENILATTPPAFRTVFVLRKGPDVELFEQRIAAVQDEVARYAFEGPPAPVVASYRHPREASALYVDEVTRRYYATTPDPRLPNDETDEVE